MQRLLNIFSGEASPIFSHAMQIFLRLKTLNQRISKEMNNGHHSKFAMDNLHVRLTFNLGKTNEIFYYS